jgi:dihydrodiol dehydrogenase / D-xylose 1-dehydrogenase (NADP)
MQLKWGIVGTGRICQDFCLALLTCNPDEHRVVAVGSRDKKQAEQFVQDFQLGQQVQTYDSQEDVFHDANVDIVYIGTIEQVHRDLCIAALNANKHVLCEKPLAMNTDEITQIITAARKTKMFVMEAIWSRFFPIYDHLRDAVQRIGTVSTLNRFVWIDSTRIV